MVTAQAEMSSTGSCSGVNSGEEPSQSEQQVQQSSPAVESQKKSVVNMSSTLRKAAPNLAQLMNHMTRMMLVVMTATTVMVVMAVVMMVRMAGINRQYLWTLSR